MRKLCHRPSPLPCLQQAIGHRWYACFLLCPGESTKGHNEVRDVVFDLAIVADPCVERLVLGLFDTAPGLRVADILTNAASPSHNSALDVEIAAPHALQAGSDCCGYMRTRKLNNYSEFFSELHVQGIQFALGRGLPSRSLGGVNRETNNKKRWVKRKTKARERERESENEREIER